MSELGDLINDLINENDLPEPQKIIGELVRYVSSNEFVGQLLENLPTPSKAAIARMRIQMRRLSEDQQNRNREQIEFLENLSSVKDFIGTKKQEHEKPYSTFAGAEAFATSSGYLFSSLNDGNQVTSRAFNTSRFRLGNLQSEPEKILVDRGIRDINILISEEKILPLSSIRDLLRAVDFYKLDNYKLSKIRKLINKDVFNRNKVPHEDIYKDLLELDHELELGKIKESKPKKTSKVAWSHRAIRALLVNELHSGLEELSSDFLSGEVTYDDYLNRKIRLFQDADSIWPE